MFQLRDVCTEAQPIVAEAVPAGCGQTSLQSRGTAGGSGAENRSPSCRSRGNPVFRDTGGELGVTACQFVAVWGKPSACVAENEQSIDTLNPIIMTIVTLVHR